MFLVVGLGNVGKKYECTRHNIGFMILDKFCEKFNIDLNKENSTGIYGMGNVNGKKIICLKPKTFMNLSGSALSDIMNYYKISSDDILVIYDDIDLDFLKLRIRIKGSHGGHNGVRDIISKINTSMNYYGYIDNGNLLIYNPEDINGAYNEILYIYDINK